MAKVKYHNVESESDVTKALAKIIQKNLDQNKKVTWFISGGSSIPIAAKASTLLRDHNETNLLATLVDYKPGVPQDHANWEKLWAAGFNLRPKQCEAIIQGDSDIRVVVDRFSNYIHEGVVWADVLIGQFGLGEGFHTGGILPHSPAAVSKELVCGYEENGTGHLTITPVLIEKINYPFINSMGEGKRQIINNFLSSRASIEQEPTQALKKSTRTLLYSDMLYCVRLRK